MKKYGVLIGLGVLLVLAVMINVRVNKQLAAATPTPGIQIQQTTASDQMASVENNQDFFNAFRTDRENVRAKELEYLETIMVMEQTDAETLADAQEQQMEIVSCMEAEFTVESMLKAKGFSDAAVTFHKGSVNVVLRAEQLTDQQAAQVLDIVCRETGETAQNVKISTIS